MNSYPFMPLYWNDFLSDNKVRVMSSCELGAYVRLLGAAWHEATPGTLPADDHSLARLAGVGAGVWRRISQRVLACFVLDEKAGRWEQKRMAHEYAALADRNERRSDSASKAAAARWSRGLQTNGHSSSMPAMRLHANGDADALRPHCLSESNSESPSYPELQPARADCRLSEAISSFETLQMACAESPPTTATGLNPQSPIRNPKLRDPQFDGLLTETQALAAVVNSGIVPDFAKMVHGDWFARGGRDGAGVAVPWSRYIAKRWAREGPEWKAGAHRSQTNSHSSATNPTHGNALKAQRPLPLTEADRDRARTGIDSTAGQALKRL
jgi:uncharacterized protein YdaU (DUF1376 family)